MKSMLSHKRALPCLLLVFALTVSLCLPASAAERDWESAYAQAMKENADDWGNLFQLVDLNLDGTPELLIGGIPGSGLFSEILHAFTFQNGQLKTISVPEYTMLGTNASSYTLYRNASTGATRIEGGYTLRAGAGYYTTLTCYYSYNGTSITCQKAYAQSVEGSSTTYYINDVKTTASKYNSSYNARNNGWTKVSSYGYSLLEKYTSALTTAKIEAFFADYKGTPALAKASTHSIQVDGQPVSLEAYGIGGSNYFKLRDVAKLLNGTQAQFQVSYDNATRQITLTTGQAYTSVGGELGAKSTVNSLGSPTTSAIYLDGQSVSFTAYNIGGNNYFKLRDLGQALGFNVTWNDATRTVDIISTEAYTG